MKKTSRKIAAVLSVLALAIMLCSCGGTEKEAAKKERTAMDDVFRGNLIDAQGPRLVVQDADKTMVFSTMGSTNYELGDEHEVCIGDKVKIDYHKIDGMFVANKVHLTKHKEEALVFGGAVTELGKTYLTVQSESLTVVFNRDDKTKIDGDLTVGDSVTVTYEGNLSENPRAISVVVIAEQKTMLEKSAHGTVAEIEKDGFVVSVDSAHACRFAITKDTVFKGDDKKLMVGDEVQVVYTGEAADKPVAKTVTIKRQDNRKYFIMDGVIKEAAKDKVVIKTSKKEYVFKIDKDTKIQNPEYYKAAHKTTITYVGDPEKDPLATSVFCSRDIVTDKGEIKPDQKKEEKKQEDKEKKEEEVEIKTKGSIVKWDDDEDKDNDEKKATFKVDGGATLQLDIKDAEISGGYLPEVGDEVVIKYNKKTMKLIDLELVYRPVDEELQDETPQAQPEENTDAINEEE